MLGNKSFCFNQHKPYKLTQTLNLQHLKTKKLNYCSPELNKKFVAIFLVQSLSKTTLRCVAKNLCNKIYVFINFAGTEVNKAKESIVLKLRVSCTKVQETRGQQSKRSDTKVSQLTMQGICKQALFSENPVSK